MRVDRAVSFLVVALLCLRVVAGEPTDLGKTLKDIETAEHWIYDDLPRGIAEAKRTGKPLLVVLRCVPCPPGKTLDVAVMQPDGELAELEKQFVCVRVIQTNGLDLGVFQYDYDMSWAAMFLNADMTIYGRYGTRNASGPLSDGLISKAGFAAAARRALELHKAYPTNKAQLAAKTGKQPAYARATDIPGLTERPKSADVRQNCIHCHMIKEFAMRAKWEAGKLTAADLYVHPLPERIGLSMDVSDGLVVNSVAAGSPAAKAGLAAGDEVVSMAGQPLVSTADMQWVLSHAPDVGTIELVVTRKGELATNQVSLASGWKKTDIGWRASLWYGLRHGVKLDPLGQSERKSHGIEDGQMALVVKGLHGRGGPKVQQAGLRMNDVIVAVDDKSEARSESDFLEDLRLNHGPGDKIKLTVLRGSERKELSVPLW